MVYAAACHWNWLEHGKHAYMSKHWVWNEIMYFRLLSYSGTCLNRLAMGLATYGRFIQVVPLGKLEILESVFKRSIMLHAL